MIRYLSAVPLAPRVKGNGSMLAFKLLLTPLFVGLISLADRRWGAKVGGWLVGLPLTSAPVTIFIALELGTTFASQMALGILMGLISQAVFCVTYAWLSFRVNWLGSWLIGWGRSGPQPSRLNRSQRRSRWSFSASSVHSFSGCFCGRTHMDRKFRPKRQPGRFWDAWEWQRVWCWC